MEIPNRAPPSFVKLQSYIYAKKHILYMDDSAAEKIRLAEKEAAENIARNKARLEKDFNEYVKKSGAASEKLSKEIHARAESNRLRAMKDAEKEVLAIRKKRKKELSDIEAAAKKKFVKAVLAFVQIAGQWRAVR